MTRNEWLTIGETTALTLVVRQLLARLPDGEAEAIREFVESRARAISPDNSQAAQITEHVLLAIENIFTAVTPEKPS